MSHTLRLGVKLLQPAVLAFGAWLSARALVMVLDPAGESAWATGRSAEVVTPSLLADYWTKTDSGIDSEGIPPTRLPVRWLGQLREQTLSGTVVVVEYRAMQRVLTLGDSLEPGVVLERIDEAGLIFDNNGRLERLPWRQQGPLIGLKASHDEHEQ